MQKGIKMIEKEEKPNPHIDTMKQRIKYLEDNDPHNAILEVLKRHVAKHERSVLPHFTGSTFIM